MTDHYDAKFGDGTLKRLPTALASPHHIAASDISGVPLPATLSSLHLGGMAERTLHGRALGGRATHRLRILGLRILGLCRGRGRSCVLQRLPTSAAKAGREGYRCSTMRAIDNRWFSHDALLIANRTSYGPMFLRCVRNYIPAPAVLPQSKSSPSSVLAMCISETRPAKIL
jgi:hypothetical protein